MSKSLRTYPYQILLFTCLCLFSISCKNDAPKPLVDKPLAVLEVVHNRGMIEQDIHFHVYENGVALARIPFESRDQRFTLSLRAPEDTYLLINGIKRPSLRVDVIVNETVDCTVVNKHGGKASYRLRLVPDTGLPICWIETDDGAQITSKEDYKDAVLAIDPGADYEQQQREIALEIRGRGNSTWGMPKKPFRLKFKEKTKFLGFPPTKNWVLLANYADKTLLRNYVAFELGNQLMDGFTPRTAFVEVYLNGEYQGAYHLTDQIRAEKSRVDIEELEETDEDANTITGGYLLEIDERLDEDHWFFSGILEFPITYKSPEVPNNAQKKYIETYIQEFESIIDAPDIGNRSAEYEQYIDVPSFIDYYLISEILKNNDTGIGTSVFLHKPRGGKLTMGPLWDFDIAAGNINYFDNDNPEGWWIKTVNRWYVRLFNDTQFKLAVKTRWNEIKPTVLPQIMVKIDEAASQTLVKAQVLNFERWPILNEWVWPNAVVLGSYEKEVEYLKGWINKRIAWMDKEIQQW